MSEQHRTIKSSRDLGAFIYDARTQRNLTQEELATKANVSRSWLIGLEQGKRPRAEMDKILSLFRALDISWNLHMTQTHNSDSENQTSRSNSVNLLGPNIPNFGDMLRASIPNFGQASGISQALDHKEQKNKTTDSE